jgi:hypothetical protein
MMLLSRPPERPDRREPGVLRSSVRFKEAADNNPGSRRFDQDGSGNYHQSLLVKQSTR